MTTLYGVWRKRWYGLALMWAVCLLGWVFVATIPNTYESRARVYVDWASLIPEKLGYQGANLLRQVDVVRRTLTSRVNMEKVVRRTELDVGLDSDRELDELIARMTNNISVQSQQADLFTIIYKSNDPSRSNAQNANLARRVVDNLIQIFMEENVASDRDDINEAIRFFEDQLAERERQLEQAERRKAEFEEKYLGMLPGQGNITTRLTSARTDLDRVEIELAQARNSLLALQRQIGGTPSTINAPSFVIEGAMTSSPTQQQIAALGRSLSDMYARGWTDQHPDVVATKAQVRRLEQQAAREAKDPELRQQAAQANPVYVNLRSMVFERQSAVAALEARRAQLQNAISEMASRQVQQPGIVAEQAKLNRDYEVLQSQYNQLLKSREEIRLRSDVETKTQQVKFRVVDPPSQPREPIAPNRPLYLSLVLLVGLGAGGALSFLLSQLHTTYITAAQLEKRFDYPVLGSVTEIVSDNQRAQNRVWLWGFGVLSLGLIVIYLALLLYELV
ncbi:XrtA system polysaccharide chain length determinant [Sphingosinicella microcystinivorans]|uniref:XrtA system polysaccharide chain length determinant n=1 Tax=Sphingosinicella microcystinivorans TaxID=335406 RepID=UPI0022F3B505|nr:XrtA system polysaccharide chain length determinant [Sphingosinicella microcystinivorans]WBX83225.1 GNVR domain-containing protein [Sphingosinicella microcystinivorans]